MRFIKQKILGLLLLTIIVVGTVVISADTDEYDYSSDFWQLLLELEVVTEGDEYAGYDSYYYMSAIEALEEQGVITSNDSTFSHDSSSELWVKAVKVEIIKINEDGNYYYFYSMGSGQGTNVTGVDKGYCTIYYLNDDGALLYSSTAPYGACGVVSDIYTDIPTKESTAEYTYTFSGWDIDLIYDDVVEELYIVTDPENPVWYYFTYDLYITATYEAVKNSYTITFLDDDDSLLSSELLEYGGEVTIPSEPEKSADDTFLYDFNGWTPVVESIVTGDATYTATYTATPINTDLDEPTISPDENGEINQNDVDQSPTVLDKDEIIQDDINEELNDDEVIQDDSDVETEVDTTTDNTDEAIEDETPAEDSSEDVSDPDDIEVDEDTDTVDSEEVQTGDSFSIAILLIGASVTGILVIVVWRFNYDED